jgi:hypothetical protein
MRALDRELTPDWHHTWTQKRFGSTSKGYGMTFGQWSHFTLTSCVSTKIKLWFDYERLWNVSAEMIWFNPKGYVVITSMYSNATLLQFTQLLANQTSETKTNYNAQFIIIRNIQINGYCLLCPFVA